MAGSTYGTQFKITTWGESHGKALGVVIDGCPAGVSLNETDIQAFMDRRKPGTGTLTTMRKESDKVEILSGVFEGVTTGCPISLMIKNEDQHSKDYDSIATVYRPGHADYTYDEKYGVRDYRGGGRSSGRETIGRVAAGAIAMKILKELGVEVYAYTKSIGPVEISYDQFDRNAILHTASAMPDVNADKKAVAYVEEFRKDKDSTGGIIECIVKGLPAGVGEPVFDKLDANLAKAVMSIGAVKAVEIGDGVAVAHRKGSENNDVFTMENTKVMKNTNHAGGVLGGISDGSDIILRAHVKPTPSISSLQRTVTKDGSEIDLEIHGRHDPVIVPRAVVVVECMTALTVLDAMFANMGSQMDYMKKIYCSEDN